jgi:hypothetical protein
MATDVTRYIKPEVERELWGRAAGRCQFDGCNRLLYKSPITQERANIAEKAHIYSFSPQGPRGRGPFVKDTAGLNDIGNLLLVCHDCHTIIDQDKAGTRYSADVLKQWKREHEQRIVIVTGVKPGKNSHVVLYGANIGEQASKLQPHAAMEALFPDWYPVEEQPIQLSMSWAGRDTDESYWRSEEQNLETLFRRQLRPLIDAALPLHFSVFALAPIPLLIKMGVLFTDKIPMRVYQLHREPQTWKWLDGAPGFEFKVNKPQSTEYPPALVIALSDRIAHERITGVLGDAVSIWELTIDDPHNDFLRSEEQLSLFRGTVRRLLAQIATVHGRNTPISIFPAMPVACAVEFGRVRMPKADPELVIYDQNNAHQRFSRALSIGATNEQSGG